MNLDNLPQLPERSTLQQLPPTQLVDMLLAQFKVIEELKAEVKRLKVSERLDSKTSSKPPSTDVLKKSEKPKKESNPETNPEPKRKPGGQPGHPGSTRKGFNRIDRIEELIPKHCNHCGSNSFENEPVLVKVQQVAQLVERPIEVVEYRQSRLRCSCCKQESSGAWPNRVIPGQDLDAGLQALLGWLGCYGQISYEKQAEFLDELGLGEVGVGTLVNTNARIAKTITNAVNELALALPSVSHLHVDETPWIVKGVKEWLWVATHPNFCLFHAADTRSRVELSTLLGKQFDGVLVSDDFSVYNGYPVAAQQKCLAHMRRHLKKLIKFDNKVQVTIGETFLSLVDEAFRQHRLWRENGDDSSYRTWGKEFRLRVEAALTEWLPQAGYEAGKLLRNLKAKAEQWWYFLEHPEIPPDNNLAERALRLAVTKRKVSGGSRSMARFEKTAKLLSVVQTCRFQGRSFIQFLKEALSAIAHPELPYPTLIPPVPT